jgi:hypothetical protein
VAQIAFLIPFLVAIPMALLFGFSLSTPESYLNILLLAGFFGIMALPLLIRWHGILLIAAWNAPISIFLLPGQPQLWMLVACASLFLGSVATALSRNMAPEFLPKKNHQEKAVDRVLLVFLAIVVLTACYRGGFGSHVLGSETYGARKYLPLFFAAIGYFALSHIQILPSKANRVILLFFGSGALLCVSNLAFMAGPSFYWLFYIFPVDYAMSQALDSADGTRLSGIAFGMSGIIYYMLARFGIRGIFTIKHPFRLLIFLAAIALSTLGGFRSLLFLTFLVLLVQFYFEGLFRTAFFPTFLLATILSLSVSIAFIHKMPLSVQRTLSFLPVEVDPSIRDFARSSTEWRLRMWTALMSDVPKYLVVGKGYSVDAYELALFEWHRNTGGGVFEDYDEQMIVGNYHSGPFSVLLSFGIPGVLAILAFWVVCIRLLLHNLSRGSPELIQINTTLLAYFVARVIFFLFFYGDISADLPIFCGLVGMSIALNKWQPQEEPQEGALEGKTEALKPVSQP